MKHNKPFKTFYRQSISGIRICLFLLLLPLCGFAQEKTASVKLDKVPLKQAIEKVEATYGTFFLYNSKLINDSRTVSVDKTNAGLTDVLSSLLQGTGIKYRIEDKQVILYVNTPTEALTASTANTTTSRTPSSTTALSTTPAKAQQNMLTVQGKVLDENGLPLPGAVLYIKGNPKKAATTTADGGFILTEVPTDATLMVTFMGYETQDVAVNGRAAINITMQPLAVQLDEVVVTGYQTLSKERTTGSYAIVTSEALDNKLQPGTKSVIEGMAAGLVLTKDGNIEIRGISTFYGDKRPLIVVDGYPVMNDMAALNISTHAIYSGSQITNQSPLDFINPENIESITVLKDAVAASIYGSNSSNGVIVISTKTGNAGKRTQNNLSYKGTWGITLKPDLDKLNLANPSDYIDAEEYLFNLNPNSYLSQYNNYTKISDVRYLLLAKQQGWKPAAEVDAQIAQLRQNNALKDIEEYLMTPKTTQQHNLSFFNSSQTNSFGAAMMYYNEQGSFSNVADDNMKRVTFDINNTWKPNKWVQLRILTNVVYTTSERPTANANTVTGSNLLTNTTSSPLMDLVSFGNYTNDPIYLYTQLYDDTGNPVYYSPVPQRKLYGDTPGSTTYANIPNAKSGLYHPEDELKRKYITNNNLQFRVGGDLTLNFTSFLSGSIGGTWSKGSVAGQSIFEAESFAMRTAFNDGTSRTNPTTRHIPDGGKIDESRGTSESWVVRAQLNYNQAFNNELHRITAIAGWEVSQSAYEHSYAMTRLGYDPFSATYNSGFNAQNYNNNLAPHKSDYWFAGTAPTFLGTITVPAAAYILRDRRAVGWYGNGSYEYSNKYILSGSIRWELSNFFGTNPEYRYKPTWSIGGSYKMAEEPYFESLRSVINRFTPRVSYGILGSNSLNYTPYLVIATDAYNTTTGGISNKVSSYPNDQLRYEKNKTFDAGLDMSLFNNRIDIGFDYYINKSYDLIASESVDETRGVSTMILNVGGVTNRGFEITLNGHVIQNKNFHWNSNIIINYNTSYVDYYSYKRLYMSYIATTGPVMVEGYPADGLWGPRFAGLTDTGSLLYYVWKENDQGELVEEITATVDDRRAANYLGPARPPFTGSWTNVFRYKSWEASFMLVSQLGGVFRTDAYTGSNNTNRFVGKRWKQAGDELKEGAIYPRINPGNGSFHALSDIFIKSSDFLKLRDVTLSYDLPSNLIKKIGLNGVKAYFQARNLFTITAKGVDVDPEIMGVGGTSAGSYTTAAQLRPEFYLGIQINL